jgi:hypothetical protein
MGVARWLGGGHGGLVAAGAGAVVCERVGLGRGGMGVGLEADLGSEPRARWSERRWGCGAWRAALRWGRQGVARLGAGQR